MNNTNEIERYFGLGLHFGCGGFLEKILLLDTNGTNFLCYIEKLEKTSSSNGFSNE